MIVHNHFVEKPHNLVPKEGSPSEGGAAPQLQVAGIIWTSGRTDQHARVVNRLGEAKLEHLRLQATLHQVGGLERKHVLKVGLGLVENAEAQQPAAGSRSNDSAQVHVAPPKSE